MAEKTKPDTSRSTSASQAAPSPSSSGGSRTPIAHPTPQNATQNAIPIPTSGRYRQPAPPSPLSRIQVDPASSTSASASESSSPPPDFAKSPKLNVPESSPCFIHSHLDRHGSLQDWLKNKPGPHPTHADQHSGHSGPGSTHLHNGPTPVRAASHRHLRPGPLHHMPQVTHNSNFHHHHHHHHHTHSPSSPQSPPDSKAASPTAQAGGTSAGSNGRETPGNGYESDRSSLPGENGDGTMNGNSVDDDEEGGSLTKQLAETAQGVREMSKELGRTRVRSRIQHVLIVTKARDNRLIKLTRELALYLMLKKPASGSDAPPRPGSNERGMVVYVDAQLRTSKRFDAAGLQKDYPHLFEPVGRRRSSSTTSVNNISAYPSTTSLSEAGKKKDEGQLRYWTGEMCSNSPHLFDFVVTLGGDGTVLFTSWLFQRIVPPVLPFALGSLGFLTNFDFANYKSTMDKVVDDGIRVNLRMRFTCTVYRAIAPEEAARANAKGKGRKAIKKPGGEILMSQVDRSGWEALEGSSSHPNQDEPAVVGGKDKEIMCFSTRPVEQFEVLNDLVVDRGPSPFVSLLELFGDEHHLTTVQADGLTVSTPTGSTAYSLSAGGSLVHPQIPAILITPICPHTLSFRPMLLPDGMELRICVPYNSRSTAWASFDGRGRVELKQGDHIKVTASKYPFPTVCADKASTDWFSSISRTLRWNEREKQKSFVVVEEDNEPAGVPKGMKARDHRKVKVEEQKRPEQPERVKEEDEADEDEEDEEEEDFDIDDKSGGESTNPSSPLTKPVDPMAPLLARLDSSRHHTSGVDTPDRFVTHCNAPPPLSQRHLVEALAAAELQSKDGEVGQRDEIRSGPGGLRVDGTHLIPPGRSTLTSPSGDGQRAESPSPMDHHASSEAKTPRAKGPHFTRSISDMSHQSSRAGKKKEEICRAKAFAFFGQDDSASDLSDEASEC